VNKGQVFIPKMVIYKYNSMGPIANANNVRGNLKLDSMQVIIDGRESFNSQEQAYRINANNTTTTYNLANYKNELFD
jgi:hypothetical protein